MQGRLTSTQQVILYVLPTQGQDLRVLEPELRASAALLSPGTGVICAHSVVTALLAEAEEHGADFSFGSDLDSVSRDGGVFTLAFSDGFRMTCDKLVNAAGLHA